MSVGAVLSPRDSGPSTTNDGTPASTTPGGAACIVVLSARVIAAATVNATARVSPRRNNRHTGQEPRLRESRISDIMGYSRLLRLFWSGLYENIVVDVRRLDEQK